MTNELPARRRRWNALTAVVLIAGVGSACTYSGHGGGGSCLSGRVQAQSPGGPLVALLDCEGLAGATPLPHLQLRPGEHVTITGAVRRGALNSDDPTIVAADGNILRALAQGEATITQDGALPCRAGADGSTPTACDLMTITVQ